MQHEPFDHLSASLPLPGATEAVYRHPKLSRGESIDHSREELVSTHCTLRAAMDEANRLARTDREHTYLVGLAPEPRRPYSAVGFEDAR